MSDMAIGVIIGTVCTYAGFLVGKLIIRLKEWKEDRDEYREADEDDPGAGANAVQLAGFTIPAGTIVANSTIYSSTNPGAVARLSIPKLSQIASYGFGYPETTPVLERAELDKPVYGWRMFYIEQNARNVRVLRGSMTEWKHQELRAACQVSTGHTSIDNPKPSEQEECRKHLESGMCTCGIYMMKEPGEAVETAFATNAVPALCVGWGAGIEGENGYRMEHVRIERLFLDGRNSEYLMKELSERYGNVPVSAVQNHFNELTGWNGADWREAFLPVEVDV